MRLPLGPDADRFGLDDGIPFDGTGLAARWPGWPGWAGEATDHERDHGPGEVGFTLGDEPLVVADVSAGPHDPADGALDSPPFREDGEAVLVLAPGNGAEGDTEERAGPGDEFATVGGVSPGDGDLGVGQAELEAMAQAYDALVELDEHDRKMALIHLAGKLGINPSGLGEAPPNQWLPRWRLAGERRPPTRTRGAAGGRPGWCGCRMCWARARECGGFRTVRGAATRRCGSCR